MLDLVCISHSMGMISAGLLMFKKDIQGSFKVFLAHPGGPFFKNKDLGYWTVPKGLVNEGEDLLSTAIREFTEETGIVPQGPYYSLGKVVQKGGKVVHAWAFEKEWDNSIGITSNRFTIQWPPRSGKFESFPEIDKAQYFALDYARIKINEAQRQFLERLPQLVSAADFVK